MSCSQGRQSTRFSDADKLTAELGGQPLVEHVRGAIERPTGRPPYFALQNSEQRARLGNALGDASVRFVRDAQEFTGPFAALTAAVAVVETSWLFVCAGTTPLRATAGAIVPVSDSPPFLARSPTNVNTGSDLESASTHHTDGSVVP